MCYYFIICIFSSLFITLNLSFYLHHSLSLSGSRLLDIIFVPWQSKHNPEFEWKSISKQPRLTKLFVFLDGLSCFHLYLYYILFSLCVEPYPLHLNHASPYQLCLSMSIYVVCHHTWSLIFQWWYNHFGLSQYIKLP